MKLTSPLVLLLVALGSSQTNAQGPTSSPTEICENNPHFNVGFDGVTSCDVVANDEDLRQEQCLLLITHEHCPISCGVCGGEQPFIQYTTETPSVAPTNTPTNAPSMLPTQDPSDIPTEIPSAVPTLSLLPTDIPSDVPSDVPSGTPTGAPSDAPSDIPTGTPTVAPSGTPTDAPTVTPSYAPTDAPTDTPTVSSPPTGFPSNIACRDDPDYRFKDVKKQSCRWIGRKQARINDFCKKVNVRNSCMIVCGECCADDLTRKFQIGTTDRKCGFLSNTNRRRNNCPRNLVNILCAESCGRCCQNDPNFTFPANGSPRDCNWFRSKPKRQERWCVEEEVSAACQGACSSCQDFITA